MVFGGFAVEARCPAVESDVEESCLRFLVAQVSVTSALGRKWICHRRYRDPPCDQISCARRNSSSLELDSISVKFHSIMAPMSAATAPLFIELQYA